MAGDDGGALLPDEGLAVGVGGRDRGRHPGPLAAGEGPLIRGVLVGGKQKIGAVRDFRSGGAGGPAAGGQRARGRNSGLGGVPAQLDRAFWLRGSRLGVGGASGGRVFRVSVRPRRGGASRSLPLRLALGLAQAGLHRRPIRPLREGVLGEKGGAGGRFGGASAIEDGVRGGGVVLVAVEGVRRLVAGPEGRKCGQGSRIPVWTLKTKTES